MIKKLFTLLLPWRLRRLALQRLFGYQIHPSARIGFAWVFPGQLVMGPCARIDHFTTAVHLDRIEMDAHASIGRGNWITGFTTRTSSPHFAHQPDRQSQLSIGAHSAITKYHHLDCTSPIHIGRFSTIAGYRSQLLTHSIDLANNRQHSEPIVIGDYTFIGTNVVILGGANLPSYSALGAKSLLNKAFSDDYHLYGGVPAVALKELPADSVYFTRSRGFVI